MPRTRRLIAAGRFQQTLLRECQRHGHGPRHSRRALQGIRNRLPQASDQQPLGPRRVGLARIVRLGTRRLGMEVPRQEGVGVRIDRRMVQSQMGDQPGRGLARRIGPRTVAMNPRNRPLPCGNTQQAAQHYPPPAPRRFRPSRPVDALRHYDIRVLSIISIAPHFAIQPAYLALPLTVKLRFFQEKGRVIAAAREVVERGRGTGEQPA